MSFPSRFASHSLEETAAFAGQWLKHIEDASRSVDRTTTKGALVVGLSGHLGAGKTAFVKAVAKILGVSQEITSPTFVLMKFYDTTSKVWPHLVHIDAYRLEKPQELDALNWEKLVSDPHNLILVEWPENVGLNKEATEVLHFEIRDDIHHISIKRRE